MPHKKQPDHLPRLKILGVGSSETRTLKANVKEALKQLGVQVIVDEVERLEQLLEYDISGIPALAYDGKILFQKEVPSVEELVRLFKFAMLLPEKRAEQASNNSYLNDSKPSAMKRILFPTDFSNTAQNALPFAIDLANRFGSQLTLLHAYQVRTTASTFIDMESYIVENVEQDMARWVQQIQAELENGATVSTKIRRDNATDAITNTAKENAYDLIVMGTHGAGSMVEAIIGTHANSVVKNTTLPVLIIPDSVAYRPFQTIVFAVDEIEDFNAATLKTLVTLAQSYASMIRVYHKDEANDGLNTSIDSYLEGLDRSYHYELDTDNLIDNLDEFVKEYDAELLCMIRRQRTFLENVFHDSATSQEAFTAKVPLLLLHDV